MIARCFCGAAVLAATALPAVAQEAGAPGQKTVQATKVFRYLDRYFETPAADRSKLRVVFILTKDGRPAVGYHPVLIDGDQRTPLPLAADGRFERLPSLEQLRRKPMVAIDAPTDAKFGATIDIQSTVRPAQEMDAREVALSIQQVGRVTHDVVGALSILMPSVGASFPGGGAGVAIFASGAETPLPTRHGAPFYDPGATKGAVKLRFSRTPSKVDLAPTKDG